MAPSKNKLDYEINEKILCQHSGLFYEGKVIEKKYDETKKEWSFLVHYQGWHKRHDEWVSQTDSVVKFKAYTPEAVEEAKEEILRASGKAGKKKVKNEIDDDHRKSEVGSRGSTPSDRAGGSTKANSTISEKTTKGGRGTKRKAEDAVSGSNAFVAPMADTLTRPQEFSITLPKPLMQVLVDDYDMINRHFRKVRLPAKYTVETIIKEYCASCGAKEVGMSSVDEIVLEYENGSVASNSSHLVQSSLGLCDYFDTLLGYQLLYKFERLQYTDELEKVKGKLKTDGGEPAPKKRRSAKADTEGKESSSTEELQKMSKPSKLYGLPHLLRLLSRFDIYLKMTSWNDRTIKTLTEAIQDFLVFVNKNLNTYFDLARDYDVACPEYQRTVFNV